MVGHIFMAKKSPRTLLNRQCETKQKKKFGLSVPECGTTWDPQNQIKNE